MNVERREIIFSSSSTELLTSVDNNDDIYVKK